MGICSSKKATTVTTARDTAQAAKIVELESRWVHFPHEQNSSNRKTNNIRNFWHPTVNILVVSKNRMFIAALLNREQNLIYHVQRHFIVFDRESGEISISSHHLTSTGACYIVLKKYVVCTLKNKYRRRNGKKMEEKWDVFKYCFSKHETLPPVPQRATPTSFR